MPDVGIVMPVYKQKLSYLKQALRSIFRQIYKNYLLVIVIDGAPITVVRTIRNEIRGNRRVKVIWKKQNQGVASALNTGFDLLKKRRDIQYLTWVSSDNVYNRNFISVLRETLKKGPPQLGLVYSNFLHINDHGKSVFGPIYMRAFRRWQNQPKENILDNCFIGASFMYKKKYAMLAGDYINEPVEDYDYWLKLTEHCNIQYAAKVLMKYRVSSPHSVSVQLKSRDQHRRWRYYYQLSKHQARLRRQIPFETTVIFPVFDGSEHTLNQFESLLEQYYSNYKLLVVDLSVDSRAIPVLSQITDPRVSFISMPLVDANTALSQLIMGTGTLYIMVYGLDSNLHGFYMFDLLQSIRSSDMNTVAAYLDPDTSVSHRTQFELNEPLYYHIYRSDRLIEAIKYRAPQMVD